jgi:cyanocobalamin reductase (cyanide-eliminating) / alkylcobalamin dealkylase
MLSPVSAAPWEELISSFAVACRKFGLDLVHGFAAADYNEHVAHADRLDCFDRPRALGLLVGNTGALWPAFTRACREDSLLASSEDPLDLFVVSSIERAIASATQLAHRSYFAHVTTPRPLPIQRLADLVGLAALSPSHLAIHAQHGPWFALRAAITVDIDGPSTPAPEPARPCRACAEPCVQALQRALAASGTSLDRRSISAHAADWIAVRDACPVGQSSRYSDAQLRYHYGVDRAPGRHGS